MRGKCICLFMWGYQHHFCGMLEYRAKTVFEALGIWIEPKALLVGVRRPGCENKNEICVEPEDGQWPLTLFEGVSSNVEEIVKQHPLRKMFYGDELSMREKPERIRRDSVRQAVKRALDPYDSDNDVHSFCGVACPVDDFYVVPVIQVPREVLNSFPSLRQPSEPERMTAFPSFIHASMESLLTVSEDELQRKEPGRDPFKLSAEEIVRRAAALFMRTPGVIIGDKFYYFDLFEQFNVISSLFYEGARGHGKLLLANPGNAALQWALRLAQPVPYRESRWARKILEMATSEISLIGDCRCIYGLGSIQDDYGEVRQEVFTIDFLDHYHWQLRYGKQVLLKSRYGEPTLPQEHISSDHFKDNFSRLFPEASPEDSERIWQLYLVASAQDHGSMIVIADDAAAESRRLAQQGSVVEPTLMTDPLLRRVSSIDGTIILDCHGVCHAIGVILDGPANSSCTPSRGSRYNSGIRYVKATAKPRLAIIVSDDHTVDIIPLLRPRIAKKWVEEAITSLEGASLDNYHQPRKWLDEYRFYLNEIQCYRVNAALDRLESSLGEVGQMVIVTPRLEPNSEMNDSYFLPE